MASHKLIIAWNNRLINNILDHDSAILIEQGNVEALSAAFSHIINNISNVDLLIEKSYNSVLTYSFDKHASSFFHNFKEFL